MTLQFQAGTTGRAANLGYRFYKADGTYSGARVTASIAEIASTGNYVADSVTIPSDAVGVYWNDDTLTNLNAIETLIDPAKFSLNDGSVNSDSVASTALVNVTAWTVSITGSLSGSVGSVTGNIGGDLLGSLTSTERNAIADALLNRDMSAVTVTNTRSPINAFRFIRNGFSISGSTMSVLGEDDSTVVYTRDLASDPNADPIVGIS